MATRGSPCCMAGKTFDGTSTAIWVVPPISSDAKTGPDVAETACTLRPASRKYP